MRPILRYDVPASLVVFLVALPLSIGIAIASDAPVLAGIIAAIVGGLVAGALGGSPLQVSGPAAGLTVVVAGLIAELGWAVTCAITVAAGVLQILFGLSRLARAALAISPVVVHAMLAGIGITIALQQIHVLLGGDSHTSAWSNVVGLPAQLLDAHRGGLFLGVLVIGTLVVWRRVPGWLGKVPGPLVAIVAATVISMVFALDVERIKIDGSLIDALSLPGLPDGKWGAVAMGVLTLFLIASVESLLSAVSVDRMHGGTRTDFNREMIGQGAANVVSGTIGGLPITGVIVRSSTNVSAGARTRASAILHGLWVLLFALPFVGVVEQIPVAALAGLLVVIGVQLVKRAHIETAMRTGDLAVYVITVVGVIFVNLLQGVLIGLALAIMLTVWRVVRARIHAEPDGDDAWRVVVDGSCSFLSLPRLTGVLARIPAGTVVTVELSVDFIDRAVYEAIDEWQQRHRASGGAVAVHDVGAVDIKDAVTGPPSRGFVTLDKRSGVAPWSSWQVPNVNGHNGNSRNSNGHDSAVLKGLALYHRRTAAYLRPHLEPLAHAQQPETLFITCTDSRIVPNIITSSGPGDLFTVRNVGNLVPQGRKDPSIEAAIAFAVEKLEISSIVVCGHSSCSAMNALVPQRRQNGGGGDESLRNWLAHAQPTLAAFDDGTHPVARSAAAAGFGTVDQLSMVNIAVQVETLAGHPLVVAARKERGLKVIGLFYDILSADALQVNPAGVEALRG
ncbi:MAG: bifunctional SulP family inorganic anion transporter/carbonic anhydrase [Mycobacterium sp.]